MRPTLPAPSEPERPRLLCALTYYAPYVSGLSEAARRVAEGLAARGWEVDVVTTRHSSQLPLEEVLGGVRVWRAPVRARVTKGVIAPSLIPTFRSRARFADVVNLHLPFLEAAALVHLASGLPLVTTYQCDVNLVGGLLARTAVAAMDRSTAHAISRSNAVVVSSLDYSTASRMGEALNGKAIEIPPACRQLPKAPRNFRSSAGMHVGFLGRIVEEKGIEHLIEAFRLLDDPEARLLLAGAHEGIAGGSVVERVRAAVAGDERIRLLGFLEQDQLPAFYASLDVFALPSVNSLEAFGIVQVEAMLAGVPVVASDLPGVRTPVQRTGFGVVVPPRDAVALAGGLRRAAALGSTRPDEVARLYAEAETISAYERAFTDAIRA